MPAVYLCPECGLSVGGTLAPTDTPRLRVLTIHEHDCNPRLLQYFNPDSQHTPPFTR